MATGPTKQPAAMRQAAGRHDGVDSGGRPINTGPTMGRIDDLRKPRYMSELAGQFWDFVVDELKGSGVLRSVDVFALASLAETYARWREAVSQRQKFGITTNGVRGGVVKAPWVTVEETAYSQINKGLREFGLTPSSVQDLMDPAAADPTTDPLSWAD